MGVLFVGPTCDRSCVLVGMQSGVCECIVDSAAYMSRPYLAIDSGGHVSDLVVARNCCMARMLPGEAELVSE